MRPLLEEPPPGELPPELRPADELLPEELPAEEPLDDGRLADGLLLVPPREYPLGETVAGPLEPLAPLVDDVADVPLALPVRSTGTATRPVLPLGDVAPLGGGTRM